MLKFKIFILYSLLCLIILPYDFRAIPSVNSQEKKAIDLDETLDKCAVYCEMLADASLYFVCNERIDIIISFQEKLKKIPMFTITN
jgi:hypothetical protein